MTKNDQVCILAHGAWLLTPVLVVLVYGACVQNTQVTVVATDSLFNLGSALIIPQML